MQKATTASKTMQMHAQKEEEKALKKLIGKLHACFASQ